MLLLADACRVWGGREGGRVPHIAIIAWFKHEVGGVFLDNAPPIISGSGCDDDRPPSLLLMLCMLNVKTTWCIWSLTGKRDRSMVSWHCCGAKYFHARGAWVYSTYSRFSLEKRCKKQCSRDNYIISNNKGIPGFLLCFDMMSILLTN